MAESKVSVQTVQRLIDSGRLVEALASIEQWIKWEPLVAEGFELLAQVRAARGEFERAEIARKRALQLRQYALAWHESEALELYEATHPNAQEMGMGAHSFSGWRLASKNGYGWAVGISAQTRSMIKIELHGDAFGHSAQILAHLSAANCCCAPRLGESGVLDGAALPEPIEVPSDACYRYQILEYARADLGGYGVPDIMLALLELQAMGIYPGNVGLSSIRFNAELGRVCFTDFSEGVWLDAGTRSLSPVEYIEWSKNQERRRLKKTGEPSALHMASNAGWVWEGGRFNLSATQLFRPLRLIHIKEKSIHGIESGKLYYSGNLDWQRERSVMNTLEFRQGERVLDVGCGYGIGSRYFNQRGCEVVGIDVDERMLEGAKIVTAIEGYQVRYRCLDLDYAELDESIETVVLLSVLHHYFNLGKVAEKLMGSGCRRIIVGCKPVEYGCKWVGRWFQNFKAWQCDDWDALSVYMCEIFTGFRCVKRMGEIGNGRTVLELERDGA